MYERWGLERGVCGLACRGGVMVGVYFQISDVQFKIFFFLFSFFISLYLGFCGGVNDVWDGKEWGDDYAEITFVLNFFFL